MSASTHEGHRARIRARYAEFGAEGLLDHQLLELLLTYAVPRKDTNPLAHALLERFGSLEAVFRAEVMELTRVPGLGENTAVFLRLQGDLLRRLALRRLEDGRGRVRMANPFAAAGFALSALEAAANETVLIACLNAQRELVHTQTLQRGTLTEAQVYPRSVAETALLRHAHGVLLMHNHPSGNPRPSAEDAAVTEAVRAALDSIGVQLADHLVVGGRFVYSFAADMVIDPSAESPATYSLEEFESRPAAGRPTLRKVMESY